MSIHIQTLPCGEIQANAYIASLDGRRDCVLIDPGDEYARLKRALGDLKLSAILLTHGHFDHIMAAGELQRDADAPVYVGAADLEMLSNPEINGLCSLMGSAQMKGAAINAQVFSEALEVAGMNFQILPTPGHSNGSVCLYLPDENTLFSGDTLFRAGFGRMDLYGGSHLKMRESLRTLFALPEDTKVYPGHGMATTIGEEKRRYGL